MASVVAPSASNWEAARQAAGAPLHVEGLLSVRQGSTWGAHHGVPVVMGCLSCFFFFFWAWQNHYRTLNTFSQVKIVVFFSCFFFYQWNHPIASQYVMDRYIMSKPDQWSIYSAELSALKAEGGVEARLGKADASAQKNDCGKSPSRIIAYLRKSLKVSEINCSLLKYQK